MRRLVPGLVACLAALPSTVLAVVFVRSPVSRDDNGVGLTPRWAGAIGASFATVRPGLPADRPVDAPSDADHGDDHRRGALARRRAVPDEPAT